MVRKRSWPAVSQICSLALLPSIMTFLILKSMLFVLFCFVFCRGGGEGVSNDGAGTDIQIASASASSFLTQWS